MIKASSLKPIPLYDVGKACFWRRNYRNPLDSHAYLFLCTISTWGGFSDFDPNLGKILCRKLTSCAQIVLDPDTIVYVR